MSTILIHENSAPSLRQVIGASLARAAEADFAVARIRLAAVDLAEHEVAGVRRWRVLLGRLDAASLERSGEGRDAAADARTLLRLFDSGRIAVRAAGLQAWYPDFAVLRGLAGGGCLTLLGGIYFGTPQNGDGPTLTCALTDAAHAASATARFDRIWHRAYDVAPVVRTALERLSTARG
ncbi:MAG TPA: hypothetical protein VF212_06065 [Longimicrobiales bacterium]